MSELLTIQLAILELRKWGASDDCPTWGGALFQRCLAVMDMIIQQRELGRHEAMTETELTRDPSPAPASGKNGE